MTKIILALVLCTACAVDDGPGICSPPDTPIEGELPAVDDVDAFPCVVRIRLEGQGSHGSGVAIGDRTVLTAAHVVKGAGLVYVSGLDVDDRVGRSGTFVRHPTMDLAVIHFSRDLDLPIAELSSLEI